MGKDRTPIMAKATRNWCAVGWCIMRGHRDIGGITLCHDHARIALDAVRDSLGVLPEVSA